MMRRNEDGMNKIIPLFHMSVGDVLRIGLMGVFVVICIALAIIILMQESKQNGLVVLLIHTGVRTRAVQWKASLLR